MANRLHEFEAKGLYNAGLAMWDNETDSMWSPFDGAAMEGPHKGTVLPRIPTFHTTWSEWLALHPDTDVMAWQPWPTHRDARHGHGTIKLLGGPGLGASFMGTIADGELDTRLKENELILGVQIKGRPRAYPLLEVRKGNNAVNDQMEGEPVTIWAEPGSHTMAGYYRTVDGRTLTFARKDRAFRDEETGSTWNIGGLATAGPMQGRQLTQTDWLFVEWHSWSSYHRSADIYAYPQASRLEPEPPDLARLVEDLRGAGYAVELEGECLLARLPLCARRGLTATVNGDRLCFYVFRSGNDASDYGAFRPHATRAGAAAVESEPPDEMLFTNFTFQERRRDEDIPWSSLVNDPKLLSVVEKAIGGDGGGGGAPVGNEKRYQDIFSALSAAGYQASCGGQSSDPFVRDSDIVRGYILPPRAVNAVWARIAGDRFMVIRFPDAASAGTHARERPSRLAAGNVVFRSEPDGQYRLPFPMATLQKPDDQIEWSTLPDDSGFKNAALAAVKG